MQIAEYLTIDRAWATHAALLIAFGIFLCLLLHLAHRRGHRLRIPFRLRPHPFPLNNLGNGWTFSVPDNESVPVLVKSFEEFRPIANANITSLPYIFITDLDDLSIILGEEMEMPASHEVLVPWLGQSLLTDGSEPGFAGGTPDEGPQREMAPEYLEITNRNARILVEQIQAECGRSKYVNVSAKVYPCVLDIMCESSMGVSVNAQLGGNSEYVNAVLGLGRLIHKRQMLSWLLRPCVFNLTPTGRKQNKFLKKILDFSEKVIVERMKEFAEERENERSDEGSRKTCYLDLFLKENVNLTVKEIQEEINNFIFSSHDRTSAAITWALFELGHNHNIQELAYLEQRDIFQGSDRAVTTEDLSQMMYLDRIIKETFRLYPSTPVVSRRLKSDVKIRGCNIPAGTDIPIFVYYIHRNPDLYPNPEKFNPDRFLPDRTLNLRRESYTPLIFGPRYSFVEEFAVTKQKVILSQVLRHFKLTSLDKREGLKLIGDFILRPKNDLRILFEPRLKR